jgi:hypothetical protein
MRMSTIWKIFIKDRNNFRDILNVIIPNRESEIAVRRTEGLELFIKLKDDEMELLGFIQQELGNRVMPAPYMPVRKENIFFSNIPRMYFYSIFSFFVETATFSVKGDIIYSEIHSYTTRNPIKKRRLGKKIMENLYRMRIYSQFLIRTYSSGTGKQSFTMGKGYPIIVTQKEIFSMINGGGRDGLLAL